MPKYFMLECTEPYDWEDSALLNSTPLPPGEKSWRFGRRFFQPPEEPIVIQMDPNHSDDMLEMENVDAFIITKHLLHALREAGVDNLDTYQTIIQHPNTGFETKDYVACNLLGLVSAADLSQSNVVGGSTDGLLDTDFDSVKIDESRTYGLLMFRLAENTSAIVIHEKVKNYLLSQGFDMLDFLPPEEWMG